MGTLPSPLPGIGEITAARIIDAIVGKDSLEECSQAISEGFKLDPNVVETLNAIHRLQSAVNKAIEAALEGLSKILATKYKTDWSRRRKDIALLAKIGETSESLVAFISDYILDPSLGTAIKNESDPDDCVTLTTIHSAKGLEASNCYLVNVSVNSYPSAKAIANGTEAIEEDRRCLYVAMTRAKDSLVIYRTQFAAQTFAPGSAVDGFNIDCGEQYFLITCPPTYITLNIFQTASATGTNTKAVALHSPTPTTSIFPDYDQKHKTIRH